MATLVRRSSGETITSVSVIEHIVLFEFKDGYTEEQETNMYEGIWTFKDRYPTILAMSMGRALQKNADGATHALVMRFPTKEALNRYMEDDWRIEVAEKFVSPFQNGELTSDFEAEVDSDLSQLYKDSEKFKEGVEHIEFYKVKEGTSEGVKADFLNTVFNLPRNVQTEIIHLTAGSNYRPCEKYTHAAVMRLPSVDALTALHEEPAYKDLRSKIDPILDDYLEVDFLPHESNKVLDKQLSG